MTTFATHDELLSAARVTAKTAKPADAHRVVAAMPARIAELVSRADELKAKWSALYDVMRPLPDGPERMKAWKAEGKACAAWREAEAEARKAKATLQAYEERTAVAVKPRAVPSVGKRMVKLMGRC